MTKDRSLVPAELAEMEAGFTKWLNMEGIGHDKYGAFIAGYMLGRMSELTPDEPGADARDAARYRWLREGSMANVPQVYADDDCNTWLRGGSGSVWK